MPLYLEGVHITRPRRPTVTSVSSPLRRLATNLKDVLRSSAIRTRVGKLTMNAQQHQHQQQQQQQHVV